VADPFVGAGETGAAAAGGAAPPAGSRGSAAEDVRALLRATLGEEALGPPDARAASGGRLRPAIRPRDGETLARALAVMGEHRVRALVRGGGSRPPLGHGAPPGAAALVLDTAELGGVHELDPEEGVVRAGAGLPLAELERALAGSGWILPLDPPGAAGTVGGALAAAAEGPRFGPPRDVVLGLDVALATGERTRCGGRVVKNVTGYDLAKLHVGAFGTLGVIEAAWLRLRPAPERVSAAALPLPEGEAGHALALEAARRPAVRVAARLDRPAAEAVGLVGPTAGPVLVLELAGDEPAVDADLAWLGARAELGSLGEGAVAALRALQGGGDAAEAGSTLRLRVALRATRVAPAAAALAAAGAGTLAYPARGLLFVAFDLPDDAGPGAADALLDATRRAVGPDAVLRVEATPPRAVPRRGAFDVDPALRPLHRALRERFDPAGVLGRGLFGETA